MTDAKDNLGRGRAGCGATKEAFGQAIIDALPAHIAVLDGRGIILAVNRSWARFATANGLPDPALVCEGANYLAACRKAAVNDPLARQAQEGIEAVLNGQLPSFSLDYPCHSPTQQRWFTMDVRGCAELSATVVSHHDISGRKKAEDAVRRANERLANIIEFLPDATFVIDQDKRVVTWNHACEIMTNTRKETVLGQGDYVYGQAFFGDRRPVLVDLLDGSRPEVEAQYEYVKRAGTTVQAESFIPGLRGGRGAHLWGAAAPLFDEQGRRCGAVEVVRDVTEIRRVEDALRESEQRYRQIAQCVPDLIWIMDLSGRFTYANAAVTRLHGFTVAEWVKLSFRETCTPRQARLIVARIQQELKNAESPEFDRGTVRRFESQQVRKDGSTFEAEISAAFLWSNEDRPIGIIGTTRDITERKEADAALRASEKTLRAIFEQAPLGIAIIDSTTGQFLKINQQYCAITGYSQVEMLDRSFQQITHGDDLQLDLDNMKRLRNGEVRMFQMDKRYIRKDGSIVWVKLTCVPLWEASGTNMSHIAMVEDITASKESQARLTESERKYRELVECANSIILRWTREGRITFLNEFGQRFFGFSAEEIVGRHVLGTIVPSTDDDGRDLRTLMDRVCADPVAFEQNVNENMRRNGERIWIAWTNKVVKDEHDQVIEILSVGTDITERKRAEETVRELNAVLELRVAERTAELVKARDRAEAADRLKSAFLASMSHELRTPLNSIIGFTGILLQGLPGPLNPEQNKQLEMVRTSSRHLLSLINDVLDLSKIEAGQMTAERESFSMSRSVETVVKALRPLAREKGLALEVWVDPAVGEIVGDRRKTEQILMNLGSNAIKFTHKGSVRVDCRIDGPDLVTSVTDTGIGIKPEDMGKLFEMFQQIPEGQPRSGGGTGLGLAICKKLLGIQGGRIWVQSQYGVGSVFSFALPLGQGDAT